MHGHAVQLVGQGHAWLDLLGQARRRLSQICGGASPGQEQLHQLVPLVLVFRYRGREQIVGRRTPWGNDALLVSHKVRYGVFAVME